MDLGGDGYNLVLLLHILGVVAGIGTVTLNGLYARVSQQRAGVEGAAISEANYEVSKVAEWAIYSIPVTGIIMVLGEESWEFSQLWITLAIVLYVVALGISHAVLLPAHRRINELSRALAAAPSGAATVGPPSEVAELESLGRRAGVAGATLNILTVVLIGLMIWKPGV